MHPSELIISEAIICLLLGMCFGSLNSLLIYRLPRGLPIGRTRSRCPACHHVLGVRDLIPLLSWLMHRGMCRHCGVRVSWHYPALECSMGLVFYGVYSLYGMTWIGLCIAVLLAQLVALCIIDYQHRIIPDELQLSIAMTGIIYHGVLGTHIAEPLAGMLLGLALGLLLHHGFRWLRHKEGLGFGDVKFMAVSGLWLGTMPLIPYLFYAGWLGILSALLWRLVNPDPRFPFGPALAMSLTLLVVYPPSRLWLEHALLYLMV
jgi:prepilin signal peptidase PulO-like enzyme (type II secretory pathway)